MFGANQVSIQAMLGGVPIGPSIKSVGEFAERVTTLSWPSWGMPWFRGQTHDLPLIPRLWREGSSYDENSLVQNFRGRAPALGNAPESGRLDKWLFLMQHFGLPTRLLDWSESALVALWFAVRPIVKGSDDRRPCVWVLNPIRLNIESGTGALLRGTPKTIVTALSLHMPRDLWQLVVEHTKSIDDSRRNPVSLLPLTYLPLTQVPPALDYFRMAFRAEKAHWLKPIAVNPVHDHPRMAAQKSMFTIHGYDMHGIDELYGEQEQFLLKIPIEPSAVEEIDAQLRLLGITASTIFPDFSGLSLDLAERHRGAGTLTSTQPSRNRAH